jgi:hypothetical protein
MSQLIAPAPNVVTRGPSARRPGLLSLRHEFVIRGRSLTYEDAGVHGETKTGSTHLTGLVLWPGYPESLLASDGM